ncbi:uncharacterized protein LOC124500007 [Dermatophagoides farinae]|uniref:Phosphatidylglycerol/phosphatidylinositol transfer protein n=1 Tax=Dermatophagoides farinae TaxID=6954 RepID=A0A922HQR3_DERFA|nr:hypothetical protein HUG17_0778 [Dermatophagoides farinae]KAH9497973.1 Phosphatidylglycerol/phosphatidylinositol transfer protein [Dermatophagoides farinae]
MTNFGTIYFGLIFATFSALENNNAEQMFEIDIQPCHRLIDTPELVTIDSCKYGQQRCHILEPGNNYTFTIQFQNQIPAIKLFIRLYALINRKRYRLPLFQEKNFCSKMTSIISGEKPKNCPLVAYDIYRFVIPLCVPESAPNFRGQLKLLMVNENKQKLFCTNMPLWIQPPRY